MPIIKELSKTLERNCVICDKKLRIVVDKDGHYKGGHYFDFGKTSLSKEYWECEGCYKG